MYVYVCIYIYIYIHTYVIQRMQSVTCHVQYGFDYHFSNLHFRKSQHIIDCSAAHVIIYVGSSEPRQFRSLKLLPDHPYEFSCESAMGFEHNDNSDVS